MTLTAATDEPEAVAFKTPGPLTPASRPMPAEPEPSGEARPTPVGFFARARRWLAFDAVAPELPPVSAPGSAEPAAQASEPAAQDPEAAVHEAEPAPQPSATAVALTAALDSLGTAHHRPFSRA